MYRISLLPIMYIRRKKFKLLLFTSVVACAWCVFGVSDYLQTKDFEEFNYPLNIDIKPLIKEVLAGKKPIVSPINKYPYKYLSNSGKCDSLDQLDLFIVVRSDLTNAGHRLAIRETFGQEGLVSGRTIKVLFFVGVAENHPNSTTQKLIKSEIDDYNDVIQMDFIDSYYNNTIKTMMQFRWLYEHCPIADYYFFIDDDMYVSTFNIFNYIQNVISVGKPPFNKKNNLVFTGHVFKSAPHRFKASKWRVLLEEYPWNKWPTLVGTRAYLLSNKAMRVLYAGSLFVRHFRFDDVYLGIVAKKAGIEPQPCPHIYYYKKTYDKEEYRNVIASHGYDKHYELIQTWYEQLYCTAQY